MAFNGKLMIFNDLMDFNGKNALNGKSANTCTQNAIPIRKTLSVLPSALGNGNLGWDRMVFKSHPTQISGDAWDYF